jgi:hypothetical protein
MNAASANGGSPPEAPREETAPEPRPDKDDEELYDRALGEEIELLSDLIELAGQDRTPTQHDIDTALGVEEDHD